jgi:hypothetical protein
LHGKFSGNLKQAVSVRPEILKVKRRVVPMLDLIHNIGAVDDRLPVDQADIAVWPKSDQSNLVSALNSPESTQIKSPVVVVMVAGEDTG